MTRSHTIWTLYRERGYTQKEIAARIGVTKARVGQIVRSVEDDAIQDHKRRSSTPEDVYFETLCVKRHGWIDATWEVHGPWIV